MGKSPRAVVEGVLAALNRGDLPGALQAFAPDAEVTVHPMHLKGSATTYVEQLLGDLVRAFPDLRVTTRRIVETGPAVTAEIKVEGTQAAAYAGAINQEKHLDIDEAWRFEVSDGRVTALDAYWCQQQLFRRLGVRRFDQVALV